MTLDKGYLPGCSLVEGAHPKGSDKSHRALGCLLKMASHKKYATSWGPHSRKSFPVCPQVEIEDRCYHGNAVIKVGPAKT